MRQPFKLIFFIFSKTRKKNLLWKLAEHSFSCTEYWSNLGDQKSVKREVWIRFLFAQCKVLGGQGLQTNDVQRSSSPAMDRLCPLKIFLTKPQLLLYFPRLIVKRKVRFFETLREQIEKFLMKLWCCNDWRSNPNLNY